MKNKKHRSIALAFPLGVDHLAQVASGIRSYEPSASWQFLTNPERHRLELRDLVDWRGDGIIAQINNQKEAEIIKELGIPCINISGVLKESPVPRVRADYYSMGKLAAEYFLKKGHKSFAFYGIRDVWYSQETCRAFEETLSQHNYSLNTYMAPSGVSREWQQKNDGLEQFLLQQEKETALLASHDPRAVEALQFCAKLGLSVPEDISILGINDDVINCELSRPSLSSVQRNGVKLGLVVAQELDKLMSGESDLIKDIVIEHGPVKERESTAVISVHNSELAQVIEYIRLNISQQINVESVANHIQRSRRWLEGHFKAALHQSPLEFIARTRAEKAKELLCSAHSYNLSEIAYAVGFSSSNQLNKACIRFYGKSAKELRRQEK